MSRMLMPVMLIATVIASLCYVRSRFLLIEMSYDIGEKRTEKSKLEQEKRGLILELTTLQSHARIEHIAKTQLHLFRPKVPVVQVVVGGGGGSDSSRSRHQDQDTRLPLCVLDCIFRLSLSCV